MVQKTQEITPLYVYLHTHWDREWYLPFNHYRAFLLERFRQTFAGLESGELINFYFDGQAVVFEDLTEIDPSFAPRIKNLMKQGLLSAGPWYVLPDQSLVSGESLIRNLKTGIEIVRQFGKPTMTGYNPDTFCHVQDLPRILKGCGVDTAMVLRGVPEIGDHNTFWWESPDGSKVLTYWFNKGLTHTTFHYTDDIKAIAEDLSSWWPSKNGGSANDKLMLFSSGKDHTQAPGQFKRKVEELNKILPEGRRVEAVSIDEFLADLKKWAKGKKLPELTGDLRDNTNTAVGEWFPAYVLDGVSSTRLYLKRANVLTERRMIRIAEPLFAMLKILDVMPYPKHELDYLWKLLLQNHPHDSICGCSVDPVHEEMMTRTQQINSFLDGLDEIALNRLNKWDGQLNTTEKKVSSASGQKNRSAAAQDWVLPVTGAPQANDPASGNDRLLIFNTSCYAAAAPVKMTWYLEAESAEQKLSENVQIDSVELEPHYLFYIGDSIYYKPIKRVKGWIYPSEVPALGYCEQRWDPVKGCIVSGSELVRNLAENRTNCQLTHEGTSGTPGDWQIGNGLIQAKLDEDGNLVVTTQQETPQQGTSRSVAPRQVLSGHHLYDVGDGGDSYNFDPLPDDTPLKAKLTEVQPGKSGPLVSSLVLSYSLDIPESLDSQSSKPEPCDSRHRSKTLLKHTINTEVSVRKDVPILFFKTTWENHSCDHRLEVRFKTEQKAAESIAECHFSTAKHFPVVNKIKLPVEVGKEAPPSGHFCQRFFIISGQVFFNCGMPEYRIENDYVAITLLRAVSYLSRGRLRTRGGGAGPWEATPEANCLGRNTCEYGFAFIEKTNDAEAEDQQIARAYQLTDLFEGRIIPFVCGKFRENKKQSLIEISNPALYVAASYTKHESLMLRVLNTSCRSQQAKLSIAFPVSKIGKVNLLGEDFQPLLFNKKSAGPVGSAKSANSADETVFELELTKNELVTLKIDPK